MISAAVLTPPPPRLPRLSCAACAREYDPFNRGLKSYVHLSAGELLRQERESGSSDGQLIDEFIREGRIVPVAITIDLLKKAMQASGPAARFLIDGFPRNSDNREASSWGSSERTKSTGFCTSTAFGECHGR